jgi:hypothetical protein
MGISMQNTFQAPWSTTLKLTTVLFVGILLLAAFAARGTATYIAVAILLGSMLLWIRGYSVQNGQVVVHGLGWNKAYPLSELVDTEANPFVTSGSLRTFGNSGLFSTLGYFKNGALGNYLAFVTDSQNAVVLDFREKRVVVSPDDPEAFVRAVREEYHRIHPRH